MTVDASLADALNHRIDRPIVGQFAMTPHQIMKYVNEQMHGNKPLGDVELVRGMAKDTGYDVRFVHGEIENIRTIRKHTMQVKKHIAHKKSAVNVLETFSHYSTTESLMDQFGGEAKDRFFGRYHKVGVIGLGETYDDDDPGFFNDLEKHFYPDEFVNIDRFCKGEEYQIDKIHAVGNDRQLASNAVALITGDPSDYAIVLNTESKLTNAVRTVLYRNNIPFVNHPGIKSDLCIRTFLEFIELALRYESLHVSDVESLFHVMNAKIRSTKKDYLLCKMDMKGMPDVRDLADLMSDVRSMTYTYLLDELNFDDDHTIRSILQECEYSEEKITSKNYSELVYLIDNVGGFSCESDIEGSNEGVLIADCLNSTYIDRSIVIYLGLDQDWNRPMSGLPYVDTENESYSEKNRLSILLQQGDVRCYLVNTSKGGRPVRPCITFDDIFEDDVCDFSVVCPGGVKTGRWVPIEDPKYPDLFSDVPEDDFDIVLSDTRLERYLKCPRMFMYSSLLNSPDKNVLRFGSLIHEYAEAYVTNRVLMEAFGMDKVRDFVFEQYAGLSSPAAVELDKDKIDVYLHNLEVFLDSLQMNVDLDVDVGEGRYGNSILKLIGAEKKSDSCERDLTCGSCPIHGKYDLLWKGHVYDYQTGKPKTPDDVVSCLEFLPGKNKYMLQPYFYMFLSKEIGVDEFSYFYVSGNGVSPVRDSKDLESSTVNIRWVKGSPEELIVRDLLRRAALAGITGLSENDMRSFYRNVKEQNPNSRSKYSKKICPVPGYEDFFNSAYRDLVKRIFVYGVCRTLDEILILDSKMDEFAQAMKVYHDDIVRGSFSQFPPDSRACRRCDFITICEAGDIDD